jgi:hypothetical protein
MDINRIQEMKVMKRHKQNKQRYLLLLLLLEWYQVMKQNQSILTSLIQSIDVGYSFDY